MTVRSVSWHSFDLRTGRRGQRMATRQMGSVSWVIGAPSETSIDVSCWDSNGPVPGWDAATLPGRTMLVAIEDDTGRPVWGGMVVRRRSTPEQWVTCDLVTLEAYFDRRFTKDHVYQDLTATPYEQMIADIVRADVITDGFALSIDYRTGAGPDHERTFLDRDDKTVLSVMQDLLNNQDAPEFTVALDWQDEAQTVLRRTLVVRTRIDSLSRRQGFEAAFGVTARGIGGGRSIAAFTLPGSVMTFDFVDDFTLESGANDVLATSSGEGDTRPQSLHAVATDLLAGGWARFERRFEPSTSITVQATLDRYAAADLADKRDGLAQVSLTANLDRAPRFGTDYNLGDDVTVMLTCPRFPEQVGPDGDRVPGYSKTTRCVAVSIDFDARTVTPTLWEVG